MSEDPSEIQASAKRLADIHVEIVGIQRRATAQGIAGRARWDALNKERLELEAKMAANDTGR